MDQCMYVWMNGWMTEYRPVRRSWHGNECVSEKAEWKRQWICEILLLWTDKHTGRKMNRMRRWHTDGIKAFTIFSYRCVRRHVSPPYFMVILQIFGVALLILIHTWWAVLIEPLLLATIFFCSMSRNGGLHSYSRPPCFLQSPSCPKVPDYSGSQRSAVTEHR